MVRELRLLLWLRWHHARGRAQYWAALAGADIGSPSLTELSYELYLVLLFGGWFTMMMAVAADSARGIGESVAAGGLVVLALLAAFLPTMLLAALGARALRSAPVKLTFPDIAYVGSSIVDLRVVAFSSCMREVVPATVAAVPLGYLFGSVALGAGAPSGAPWAVAITLALVVSFVLTLAWAVGLARVRTAHRPWPSGVWLAAPIAAALSLIPPEPYRWPGVVLADAVQGGLATGRVLGLLASLGTSVVFVLIAGQRMDMVRVIEESALYAQLQVFRPLQLYDPRAYVDIVRRKRIGTRRPSWSLPSGGGYMALISRAVISHIRQPRTLMMPVLWGAAILPYVASLAAGPHKLLVYFPATFLFVAGPHQQLVHVFSQDADRPSLREMLPFENLSLVLADSSPVIAELTLAAAAASVLVGGSVATLVLRGVLAALLGIALVLLRALERLTLPSMRNPIGSGVGALVTFAIVMYAGSVGSLGLACVAATVVVIVLGRMVQSARL